MRTRIFSALLAVTLTVMSSGGLRADLDALEVVGNFNSMNDGRGFDFQYSNSSSLISLTTTSGTQNVTNTVYTTGRGGMDGTPARTYFYSFCVNPSLGTVNPGLGNLNYEASTGYTYTKNSNGTNRDALSLGAAHLYKQYATSLALGNINAGTFATALQVLNGTTSIANWASNTYLAALLNENALQSYWTAKYDTRRDYAEMGNYVVFVMNVTNYNGTSQNQDFLYIAHANTVTGNGVPEPATFLFWTLGGLGFVCTSRARSRRMKRLALA